MENNVTALSNNINTKTRTYQLADISKMAKYLAASRMCGIKNEAEAFVILMIAENEGINPIQASLDYNIIKGNPTIKSSAALRRFLEAGGKITYKVYTDKECTVHASHPTYGEIEVSWTIEKASKIIDYYDSETKQPHFLTDKLNWKNYPRDMLKNRAVSEALRTIFPTGMKNLYTTEESMDFGNDENIINVIDVKSDTDMADNNYNIDKNVFEHNNNYDYSPYNKYQHERFEDMETKLLLWHINESQMRHTHREHYNKAVEVLKQKNKDKNTNTDKSKGTNNPKTEINTKSEKQDKKEIQKTQSEIQIDNLLGDKELEDLTLEELKAIRKQSDNAVFNDIIANEIAKKEKNEKEEENSDIQIISDDEQYDIVPIGKNKGKNWSDLSVNDLVQALEYFTSKNYNENYQAKIKNALNEKLSVCPVGISKGLKWIDLSVEKLQTYLSDYKAGKIVGNSKEYIEYIENVLKEKQKEKSTSKSEDYDPFSDDEESFEDMIAKQEKEEKTPPNQLEKETGFDDENIPFN